MANLLEKQNAHNFFTWRKPSEPVSFPLASKLFPETCSGLPNQYGSFSARLGQRQFKPIAVEGEELKYILNSTTGFPSVENTEMSLVVSNGKDILATITTDSDSLVISDDDSWVPFQAFTMPTLSSGNRTINFALVDNVTSEIYLVSNDFEYNVSSNKNKSSEIAYTHPDGFYGYPYAVEDPGAWDKESKVRIPLSITGVNYNDTDELYREVTTNESLIYNTDSDREYTVETFLFDVEAHDSFHAIIRHFTFAINGDAMQKNGGYSISYSTGRERTNGSVSMIDKKYARINNK